MDFHKKTGNGKQKSRRFSFIRLPFAHRAYIVCPPVDEETNGNYPFANGLKKFLILSL
jgi:hypothetical protein